MKEKYVIDGTFGRPTPNSFCFCPIEKESVIVGLSILGTELADGEIVGVYHSDGQEAADNFYKKYKKDIDRLIKKQRRRKKNE